MKLSLKFGIILLILAVMMATGCTESDSDMVEISEINSDTTSNVDKNETIVESEIESIDESVTEGFPELEIITVNVFQDSYMMDVVVKNTGNATAEDVYCGIILYGASNELAFSEYMTLKELKKIIAPSIKEGVTGYVHEYETDYRYKDTPNLTIEYKFASVGYLGDIPAEKTEIGHISIPSGTYRSTYLKVAWMDGLEDEFVIY